LQQNQYDVIVDIFQAFCTYVQCYEMWDNPESRDSLRDEIYRIDIMLTDYSGLTFSTDDIKQIIQRNDESTSNQ